MSKRSDPKGMQWDPEIKKEIIHLIDRCTEEWSKLNAKYKKLNLRLKVVEERLK